MMRNHLSAESSEGDRPVPVLVLWCPRTDRDLARRMISSAGRRSLGLRDDALVINHCGKCGSAEHGQPLLAPVPGGATPHVSISYAEDVTVVALTGAGPVGVDVERYDAASFPGFDAVAAHEEERMDAEARQRTIIWVRKESLLKATGRGLTVDPRRVRITAPDQPPGLIQWAAAEPPDGPVWMQDVAITSTYVAAVTVLSKERPKLVVRKADSVAPPEKASR